MAKIVKKNFDCSNCKHKDVCKYIDDREELYKYLCGADLSGDDVTVNITCEFFDAIKSEPVFRSGEFITGFEV